MATAGGFDALQEQIDRLSKEIDDATPTKQKQCSPSFLLMPSQKKIKSFTGKEADISLDDWCCDIQASIASRPLSEEDKVHFMFQHLEGAAREEVKLRPQKERSNVEDLLQILYDVFGVKATGVQLQRLFFECKQKRNESLRDFSHHLMDKFNKASKKCPHLIPTKDKLLCDQFSEGVCDNLLHKHLKKQLRDYPNMPFLQLRKEATEWSEEDIKDIKDDKDEQVTVYETKGIPSSKRVNITEQVQQLKGIVEEQQSQIKTQQAQIEELLKIHYQKRPYNPASQGKDNTQSSFQTRTTTYCDHCQRKGHLTSNCFRLQLQQAEARLDEYRKAAEAIRPNKTESN